MLLIGKKLVIMFLSLIYFSNALQHFSKTLQTITEALKTVTEIVQGKKGGHCLVSNFTHTYLPQEPFK